MVQAWTRQSKTKVYPPSRFSARFQDPMGRWSTLSLIGRNKRIVHFITVYQVVAKDSSGPYTAFQQQLQCLRLADRDIPPRRAFLIDFKKYIKSLQTPLSQFVVMGDFNKVVGTSMLGFTKITSEFRLVDVLGNFHSVRKEVSTYARGPNRLDYVFCSNALLSTIVACGAEPFNQHIFSDHRALFVDWDEVLLFGAQTPSIQSQKHRRLQSKSIPSRIQYIDSLHHFCTEHRLDERLKQLHENPCPILAESIDKDLTQGMLSSEKKCRSHGEDPWSLVLQQARLRVDIFRHALSMIRLGLENHHKI
jgi:hypothetical protein